MSKSSLQITGRKGEWYVVDPSGRMETCGPYETKDEAEEDRRGLERFWAAWRPSKPTQPDTPAGILF